MSDRTRREELWIESNRVWRVQDDRSGFVEYSTDVIIDHKGRVTRPEYADPIHPFELPMKPIVDDPSIPYCRPDPLSGIVPDPADTEIDVESI